MLRKAILKTAGMFDEHDKNERDYELWKSVAEYMDGETALVADSAAKEGAYVFLGLENEEKDKELFYMIEQDSMTGMFIDDKEGFDKAWNSREYDPDGCLYLEKKHLEFIS